MYSLILRSPFFLSDHEGSFRTALWKSLCVQETFPTAFSASDTADGSFLHKRGLPSRYVKIDYSHHHPFDVIGQTTSLPSVSAGSSVIAGFVVS